MKGRRRGRSREKRSGSGRTRTGCWRRRGSSQGRFQRRPRNGGRGAGGIGGGIGLRWWRRSFAAIRSSVGMMEKHAIHLFGGAFEGVGENSCWTVVGGRLRSPSVERRRGR